MFWESISGAMPMAFKFLSHVSTITADRKFEDVVKSAQDAAVPVLVY
jgi:hypothetical protein